MMQTGFFVQSCANLFVLAATAQVAIFDRYLISMLRLSLG
jgi:hypothetical protein